MSKKKILIVSLISALFLVAIITVSLCAPKRKAIKTVGKVLEEETTAQMTTTEEPTTKERQTTAPIKETTEVATSEESTTEIVTTEPPTTLPPATETVAPKPVSNAKYQYIYGEKVNYGCEAFGTSSSNLINEETGQKVKEIIDYETYYYAKDENDAISYFNSYVEKLKNGNYHERNAISIYCDNPVPLFNEYGKKIDETENGDENNNIIDNVDCRKLTYNLLVNTFSFDKKFAKYNTNFCEFYHANNIYRFVFVFFDTPDKYNATVSKAKEYANSVKSIANDYDKISALCKKFSSVHYSLEGINDEQSAYSAFFTGNTVCAGITRAINMCLDELGYENEIVHCYNGPNPHAFTMVKLNDHWYYLEGTKCLDNKNNIMYVLVGKDVLSSFKIIEINKVDGSEFTIFNCTGYSIYDGLNFGNPSLNSASHELADTSLNQEVIIKQCLLNNYKPDQYTYRIVPGE